MPIRGNSTLVGGIFGNGNSSITYNTTSDYRLKENVVPVTIGLETISSLNPVNFDWIIDKRKDTGFLAHELQAVIPNVVIGEKDAIDENGKPIYQVMDNSGVIPFLVAAIKELNAKVTALEEQVLNLGVK
jgi:hypothetical protein